MAEIERPAALIIGSGERVNQRLETTAPDVWAMGECAGSPQFTDVASDDFPYSAGQPEWRKSHNKGAG